MSIYASYFAIGDEHKPRCKRIRRLSKMMYQKDDSKPCTCGASPIEYQGSHVFPSAKDKRGGEIGFAAIPGHITRSGKDEGKRRWNPWLRFHLHGGYQDSLILTRPQVKELRNELSRWLEQSEPLPAPPKAEGGGE